MIEIDDFGGRDSTLGLLSGAFTKYFYYFLELSHQVKMYIEKYFVKTYKLQKRIKGKKSQKLNLNK